MVGYYFTKQMNNKYVLERNKNTQNYIIKNNNTLVNMIYYIQNWITNKKNSKNNKEYSNIDNTSSLNYQETEFLLSEQ